MFLDTDTGIEPGKADSVHVTKADLAEVWAALSADDILAVTMPSNKATQPTRHTRVRG